MIRRIAIAAALVSATLAAPVALAGNVGWSVTLGAPGFGVAVGQPAYGSSPAFGLTLGAPYYGGTYGYWALPAAAYPVYSPVYAPYRYRPYYPGVVYRGPVVYAPRPVVHAPRPYGPVFIAAPPLAPYRPYR